MTRKGKGKHFPIQQMAPEIKQSFQALIALPGPKHSFLKVRYPAHWRVIKANVNQLWRWDTLEDVNI